MKLEINLPQQIYERLQAESSIPRANGQHNIAQPDALFLPTGRTGYGENPFTIFREREE